MTDLLARIGHFGVFAGRVAWRVVTPPWNFGDFFRHAWIVSLRCLGPVIAVTFPFGMVIGLQGLAIFNMFGAQRLLPSLISVAVLRELSPVLASVLVAAQAGSSYAAELGSMRIKEELDATEIMAVDSLRWHVAPRVAALILACPILNTLGDVAGLAGGYTMSVLIKGEPGGVFMANLWGFTHAEDLLAGLIKTSIFGAIIGLIACYHGFYTTGGAAGVGRAVNDTVVRATLTFFAANYIITSAMFA
ncbi:ABC transporter permease [Deltaproteobacteria bacterium]|nr:ABC transporter permease [Deltaproteobacteria bacterium]